MNLQVRNFLERCADPPCGVTNIRLELTTEIPYQKRVILKSFFRWKPSSTCKYDRMINVPNVFHITRAYEKGNKACSHENLHLICYSRIH